MAQLSTIVSSILRDMVYAQHQANMYAISLEDVYRKNGRLEDFAMPAIALGEMQLSLRYGIADSSVEIEQYEINYPALREMAKTFSVPEPPFCSILSSRPSSNHWPIIFRQKTTISQA